MKLAILALALSSFLLSACNQTMAQPPVAASTNVTAAGRDAEAYR